MPSPLAHIATGCALALACNRGQGIPDAWRLWVVCLGFSMAPDTDAVIGILFGRLAIFHNQFTHSLGFGVALCAACIPLTRLMLPRWSAWRAFLLATACFGMHLLLDWMTYGRGVMVLWPLSDTRFKSPVEIFHGLRWSEGIFSTSHLHTLINETGIIALVTLLAWGIHTVLNRRRDSR